MKASLIFAVFILTFSPFGVLACAAPPPLPDRDAREASLILMGYVTGERYPAYEKHVQSAKNPALGLAFDTRYVRVVFTDSIRGKLIPAIEVPVPCDSPLPRIRERVAFVRVNGKDSVISLRASPNYLGQLAHALSSGR